MALYDSTGKYVGALLAQNVVSTLIGNTYVAVNESYNGFTSLDSSSIEFFHLASDCSDARYVDASGTPAVGNYISSHLYYPNMAALNPSYTVVALEYFNSGADVSAKGMCVPFSGITFAAAPALITVPSFTPPFVVR